MKSAYKRAAHPTGAYPGFRSIKQLRVFLLPPPPLDGMLVHCRVTLRHLMPQNPFIHPGGDRHCENKVSCPLPGLEPGPLALVSRALTMRQATMPPTRLTNKNKTKILMSSLFRVDTTYVALHGFNMIVKFSDWFFTWL